MSKMATNQKFAVVAGAVLTAIGLAGFAITGFSEFASRSTGKELLIFEINPLHNVVHLLSGVTLLMAARTALTSRMINAAIGVVYLLVGVVGLFVANSSNSLNVLSLNQPDNGFHLAVAVLALGVTLSEKSVMAARA